jgi:hypothetical protein
VSSRKKVCLRNRQTRQDVEADFIDQVEQGQIEAAMNAWKPVTEEALRRMAEAGVPVEQRPQHGHWDWRRKHANLAKYLRYQFLGIECDNEMQGLCLIQTAGMFCRIPSQLDKGLVYIQFLETAPWNSPMIVDQPRYALTGSMLLAGAIEISIDLDFKGCIGLHALPQAEGFYSKAARMTDLGIDDIDDYHRGLRYFEMTQEQAINFMNGG